MVTAGLLALGLGAFRVMSGKGANTATAWRLVAGQGE